MLEDTEHQEEVVEEKVEAEDGEEIMEAVVIHLSLPAGKNKQSFSFILCVWV
jgi:hypothetical protein